MSTDFKGIVSQAAGPCNSSGIPDHEAFSPYFGHFGLMRGEKIADA